MKPSHAIHTDARKRVPQEAREGTAMASNFGLNPPASRVTALAGQAPRHSGRGLGVRWTDRNSPDTNFS